MKQKYTYNYRLLDQFGICVYHGISSNQIKRAISHANEKRFLMMVCDKDSIIRSEAKIEETRRILEDRLNKEKLLNKRL